MTPDTPSLWDTLKASSLPTVLYGTGNGADKILDVCECRGIRVDGVFASSSFVRERTFREMKVESFEAIKSRLGEDINVLLAFGTDRAEVVENVERIGRECHLYIPEVPLYGGELFDRAYLERYRSELERTREMLDERGKEYFDAAVNFRLTGEYKYLKIAEKPLDAYLRLAKERRIENVIDLGAYKGDSAEMFSHLPDIKEMYAVEPDPKTFVKLREAAAKITNCRVTPLNFAASDEKREVTYSASGSRGAGVDGKNRRAKEKTVLESTVDSLNLEKCDLIKIDVEGFEAKALRGSHETIERTHPALAVSLYHRTEDIFALPLYLKKTYPYLTHFTLHRPFCIPLWDLTLIAY